MGRVRTDWLSVMVCAPALGVALAWVGALAIGVAGRHPVWRTQPITLSEAAALRDAGEVARLVESGERPDTAYDVRAGFLFEWPVRLTPVEAAVAASRSEILQLLLDSGVSLDAHEWSRAWCATSEGDVRRVLESARPAAAVADCGSLSELTPRPAPFSRIGAVGRSTGP